MLSLSYGCLVTVNILQLFLTVPWVGLRCVIVVCPDHTNLLILSSYEQNLCLMVLDRLLTLSLSLNLKAYQMHSVPIFNFIFCHLFRL